MQSQWCVQLLGHEFKEKRSIVLPFLFSHFCQLEFDMAEAQAAILAHKMEATCERYQSNKMEGAMVSATTGLHITLDCLPFIG